MGQLPSKTFTAHPKIDSVTGNMVAFGYEAEGFGSKTVSVFEFTPQGKLVWNAKVEVPYVGMLHDFAVTAKHIVLYVIPLAMDQKQMDSGGPHWSWDGTLPTYFGFVRRGGDGKDVQFIKGPTRSATHVMGVFDDGNKLYIDVEMSMSNPFPFMPMHDGSRWDPVAGSSHITRLTVDLSKRKPAAYDIEQLYPHVGALPRQDDRYNTVAYRYGFLPCPDPEAKPGTGGACYARFDHQTRKSTLFNAGTESSSGRVLFRAAQRNRAGRLRLSDGRCDAQHRRRPRGSRDPRCRALERRPRGHRALANACGRPDPRLVGAGGAAAEGLAILRRRDAPPPP